MSHILHAYSVTVHKRRDTQARLLGNFDEAGADLLKLFVDFFNDPSKRDWMRPEINAAARVDKVCGPDDDHPDIMAAMVKSGEMGVASEFVATTEDQLGETSLFQRKREHAELVPVLVLAKIPGTRSKGFLITHSPSGRGIKTRFWDAFREWFGERFSDYRVDLDPTVPSSFYRKVMEKEGLKQVTLIRQLKPSDMVADDSRWFDERTLGTVRTVITPSNRLHHLRKTDVLAVLNREKNLDSLLVFRGDTYDEIRVTFSDSQGRAHSIYLGEGTGRAPRAGYDVTDQLKYGDENNYPTYESLRQAALQYIDLLIESAGGST